MTYKSTRIYDFKLLDRLIDFDTLIDHAVEALMEFNESNIVEGYIGCTLDLIYPDLSLVDDSKGGWVNRVQRLTEKVHRKFSDVDWTLTTLRSNLFNTLDFLYDKLP